MPGSEELQNEKERQKDGERKIQDHHPSIPNATQKKSLPRVRSLPTRGGRRWRSTGPAKTKMLPRRLNAIYRSALP